MSRARIQSPPVPGRASFAHQVASPDSSAEQEARAAAGILAPSGPAPRWSFASVPSSPTAPATGPGGAPELAVDIGGEGRPIEPAIREQLSARLGVDLAAARVHDDASAVDTARRAGGEAVTIGTHILFAPGRYDVHSLEGRRRIAHEATHVAQNLRHPGPPVARRDGNGTPVPATTLAGLPEKDRKLIQVVTTDPVATPTKDKLKAVFEATSISSPADKVEADASVPAAVRRGLINLAGEWSSGAKAPLTPNTAFTVELDLSAHGGSKGLFRFTFTSPAATKGATAVSRIIIEGLGTATAPSGTDKPASLKSGEKDAIAEKMTAASITHSGYKSSEESALRAAISLVPASHLTVVKGLKFKRDTKHATKPDVGGNYDPKSHTITMFDRAFEDNAVKFDEAGVATSAAARAIVHEIGHAVDLAPLRAAWAAKEAADKAVNDAAGEFRTQADKDKHAAAVKAAVKAEEALAKAQSPSGTRTVKKKPEKGKKPDPTAPPEYEDVIGDSHKGIAFREAVKKDGKDVSKYAEEDWQESYAEAYSLFLTSKSTLKALRPATYDYLDKNLPK